MQFQSLLFPLLIVLLAVPLFLQARKQKRAMQEQQKLQNSLSTGDRVMTTSGLFGTVVSTSEDSIDLEVAPGLVTTWVRAAIREKVTTDSAQENSTDQDGPEDSAAESNATESNAAESTTAESSGTESAATESSKESTAEAAESAEKQKTS